MENRNLYTFKKVCELSSITKAAEQLGYAQSTVTTQIKVLENELGLKLFERYGNTLKITSAGEKLLAYSQEIGRITEELFDAIHEEKEVSGSLRIAAVDSVCMTILPDMIKRFLQQFPQVNIKIVSGSADKLKHDLASGQADIALLLDVSKPTEDFRLLAEKTVPLHFYTAAATAADAGALCLAEFKQQKFVLTEPACQYRKKSAALFAKHGFEPDILMESASTEAIMRIVESGMGITYLPELVANDRPGIKKLAIAGENNDDCLMLQLLMHKNKWTSATIRQFVQTCEEHIFISSRSAKA